MKFNEKRLADVRRPGAIPWYETYERRSIPHTYQGDTMGNLTPNFDREEYACKCGCGDDKIKDELATKVQLVRNILGRSIRINSGVRCNNHNIAINASASSSHIGGWAADLGYAGSAERYELIKAATQVFDRVGIAKTFIHVDVDANKTAGVIWLYS